MALYWAVPPTPGLQLDDPVVQERRGQPGTRAAGGPRAQRRDARRISVVGAVARFRAIPRPPAGLLVFAAYAALGLLLTAPVWRNPSGQVIGAAGDPLMHVWQMAWPPYALTHGLNPFYTYWLNAPVGSNLMWDVPPLPGIVMWPVTAIAGPIASYNALAVIAIALSGACMFIAARAITKSHVAAAVAGLVYAFSPFMLASASGGHTSLTLAFCPPLLLFLGYDTLVRRKWRSLRVGIATGAVLAAQYMTFPEGVAIAAVGTLVMVTWSSVMGWRRIDRALLLRTATVIVSAALTMALLAYPAAAVMFFGRERLAAGTVHGPDYYVSDLLGFVLPAPSQAVSFNLSVADHFTGNPFEWTAYLGIPLLLILLVTVCLLHRRRSVLTAFATLVTVALLSMGPHLHLGGTVTEVPLPWSVLQSVPLLSFLLPGRLIVLVFLMAALLLACLVAALRRRPHSLRANLVWLVTLAGFGAIAVSWWCWRRH